MKKLLVTASLLLFFSSQAYAASTCGRPIAQGTWELGSATKAGYNHYDVEVGGDKVADYSNYNADFDLAYYVIDNVALGLFLNIIGDEVDFDGPGKVSSDRSLLGPEVIWNFCAEERLWMPFNLYLKLGGGYASTDAAEHESDGWGLKFDAGVKFFLHEAVSVNLFYEYGYMDVSNDTVFSGSGVGLGLSFYKVP